VYFSIRISAKPTTDAPSPPTQLDKAYLINS
jgi:hypothetical protein